MNRRALILLLSLVFSFQGCKESPGWVKEGPPFTTTEKASPGRALIYVYWPREEQGGRNRLWVGPCGKGAQEFLPGSYRSFVVEPGSICRASENDSDMGHEELLSLARGAVRAPCPWRAKSTPAAPTGLFLI